MPPANASPTVVAQSPAGVTSQSPTSVTITFSQPMVAVTSQEDASVATPVVLKPQPPRGRWRWIGTRTVVFSPDVRLPQATTYHVEIPAGTQKMRIQVLSGTVNFHWAELSAITAPPSAVKP